MKSTKFIALNQSDKDWWVVDGTNQILGRLASELATILRGKNKACYSPFQDNGDFVVVVNCKDIRCTTKEKTIWWHTGFPGGIRSKLAKDESPDKLLINAVRRMLPRGPLARQMLKKLKVYNGDSHPHAAQEPKKLIIQNKREET